MNSRARASLAVIAATVCGCSLLVDPISNGERLDVSARRITVTYPPGVDLDDFVIGIRIDDEMLAAAAPDALRFRLVDGSDLDHELEPFTGPELYAWVRLPVLPATGGLELLLTVDSEPVADPQPVFNATNYAGVWHLGAPPAPTQFRDSTPHGNDGVSANLDAAPAPASGIFGAGVSFDETDSIVVGDDDAFDVGMSSFSYSLWLSAAADPVVDDEYAAPFHKGGSSASTQGFGLEAGTNGWSAGLSDGTQNLDPECGSAADFGTDWVYLAVVVDRELNQARCYANGQERDTIDITSLGSLSSSETLQLGRLPEDPFEGLLDEVRVYQKALPFEWIQAAHVNLAFPESFFTVERIDSP